MAQEDKELLLKDLCAKLPYGVKINVNGEEDTLLELGVDTGWINASYDIEEVKPYLRPMSSMTEEEREEWADLFMQPIYELEQYTDEKEAQDIAPILYGKSHSLSTDWLNKKMFDYHGLIPMGLAIEASEGMY